MPVVELVPSTPQGGKPLAFGLIGYYQIFSPEAIANTLSLKTSPSTITADTYLYGPTDPQYAQFETVTTGNINLQTNAPIVPKWPFANPGIGNYECCGNCWAYSNAKCAFARYCIHQNKNLQGYMFSVDRVTTCASYNTNDGTSNTADLTSFSCYGCDGGNQYFAWKANEYGMSVGGGYSLTKSAFNPSASWTISDKGGQLSCPATPNYTLPCGPTDSSACKNPPAACDQSGLVTFNCTAPHQAPPASMSGEYGPDYVSEYAVTPYWKNAMFGPTQPGGASVDPTDLPFYAAALYHELVGNKDPSGPAFGGPVVIAMQLPCESQLQKFKATNNKMFMFTENDPKKGCKYGGHAIMLTGWFWVDQDYLLKQTSDIKNYYRDEKQDYLDSTFLQSNRVHYLVWWIQNQWNTSWGYNGSFPCAASFFMVTDNTTKTTTFVPLAIQSTTYLEINACAGNFFVPEKKPQAHHYDLMLAHRKQRLERPERPLRVWTEEARRYWDFYVAPYLAVYSRLKTRLGDMDFATGPASGVSSAANVAAIQQANMPTIFSGSSHVGGPSLVTPFAQRAPPLRLSLTSSAPLLSQALRDNTPVDARMVTTGYAESLGLTQELDTFMSRYYQNAPQAAVRSAMFAQVAPTQARHYRVTYY